MSLIELSSSLQTQGQVLGKHIESFIHTGDEDTYALIQEELQSTEGQLLSISNHVNTYESLKESKMIIQDGRDHHAILKDFVTSASLEMTLLYENQKRLLIWDQPYLTIVKNYWTISSINLKE